MPDNFNVKKYEAYKCYFDENDILIENYRLNSVHIIPEQTKNITETDFYMDTGNNIYLLRIINNNQNKITFCDGEIIYIIVEKPISLKIEKELEIIIRILEKIKIPGKIKKQASFSIY